MKPNIYTLKNRHKGKTAVVVGSGPTVLAYINLIPEEALIFSVNTRPLKLFEKCDYLVFTDMREAKKTESMDLKGAVRLSNQPDYTDYSFEGYGCTFKGVNFSSIIATHIACHMGCDPVILIGMDCYRGKPYFDAKNKDKHYWQDQDLEILLRQWRHTNFPNVHVIKSVNKPLSDIFGLWKGGDAQAAKKKAAVMK